MAQDCRAGELAQPGHPGRGGCTPSSSWLLDPGCPFDASDPSRGDEVIDAAVVKSRLKEVVEDRGPLALYSDRSSREVVPCPSAVGRPRRRAPPALGQPGGDGASRGAPATELPAAAHRPRPRAGTRVWDADGNVYLDLAGRASPRCLSGTAIRRSRQAAKAQLDRLWHTSTSSTPNLKSACAELLTAALESWTGPSSATRAPRQQGECASLALAPRRERGQAGRFEFICFEQQLSRCSTPSPPRDQVEPKYQKSFEPLLPGVLQSRTATSRR